MPPHHGVVIPVESIGIKQGISPLMNENRSMSWLRMTLNAQCHGVTVKMGIWHVLLHVLHLPSIFVGMIEPLIDNTQILEMQKKKSDDSSPNSFLEREVESVSG